MSLIRTTLPQNCSSIANFVIDGSFQVVKEIPKATLGSIVASIFWNLFEKIQTLSSTSLNVTSNEEAYDWIIEWLQASNYADSTTHLGIQTSYTTQEGCENESQLLFVPDFGQHIFKYKGKRILITRKSIGVQDSIKGGLFESVRLTILGRNRNFMKNIIKDAMELSTNNSLDKTIIYCNFHGSWKKFGSPRTPRLLDSVILDKGVKEKIIRDVDTFMNSQQKYQKRGIPYRRGYLFYGPPGTGKSSFINALAGYLKLNICVVNLSSPDMDDDSLNLLLNKAPTRCIILLEDVDAAKISQDNTTKLTLTGLLNALDGIAAFEGKMLFMTTNHPENLEPALIRPAKCNNLSERHRTIPKPNFHPYIAYLRFFSKKKKQNHNSATHYQIKNMLKNFYFENFENIDLKEKTKNFISKLPEKKISTAILQEYFMNNLTIQNTFENIQELKNLSNLD